MKYKIHDRVDVTAKHPDCGLVVGAEFRGTIIDILPHGEDKPGQSFYVVEDMDGDVWSVEEDEIELAVD